MSDDTNQVMDRNKKITMEDYVKVVEGPKDGAR